MVIGDLAAGLAAVAALTALYYARQTIREARADRLAAEQARLSRRLEWVGETVEHIDRLAEDDQHMLPMGEAWRRGCRLLAQGFVGLHDLLPQTAQLMHCADVYSVRSIVAAAREEVGTELGRLAHEQARLAESGQHGVPWQLPHWVAELGARWNWDGRRSEPRSAQRPPARRMPAQRQPTEQRRPAGPRRPAAPRQPGPPHAERPTGEQRSGEPVPQRLPGQPGPQRLPGEHLPDGLAAARLPGEPLSQQLPGESLPDGMAADRLPPEPWAAGPPEPGRSGYLQHGHRRSQHRVRRD